jgi:hypothetical protein
MLVVQVFGDSLVAAFLRQKIIMPIRLGGLAVKGDRERNGFAVAFAFSPKDKTAMAPTPHAALSKVTA